MYETDTKKGWPNIPVKNFNITFQENQQNTDDYEGKHQRRDCVTRRQNSGVRTFENWERSRRIYMGSKYVHHVTEASLNSK